MGEFLTKLEYNRIIKGEKVYIQLTQPLVYEDSKGERFIVPIGFISDGSSQPKITWSLIGHPLGVYLESSVIHDYLCFVRKSSKRKQRYIDWVFIDAMESQEIKLWKRKIMYRSIRLFGWIHRIFTNDKENLKLAQKVED